MRLLWPALEVPVFVGRNPDLLNRRPWYWKRLHHRECMAGDLKARRSDVLSTFDATTSGLVRDHKLISVVDDDDWNAMIRSYLWSTVSKENTE